MDTSSTSSQGKTISEAVTNVLPPTELNAIFTKEIQRKMDDGEELGVSAACLGEVGKSRSSELVVYSDKTQVTNEEIFSESSSKTCHQINRKRNFNATMPAGEELNQEDVPVSRKRDRRPNTQLKLEEGYDYSWLCPKESSSKLGCRMKKAAGAKKTLKRCGAELIGRRVKIWCELDRKFYRGKITAFNRFQKLHRIYYDDGDKELLDLSKELWKLVGDEELSNVEQENGPGPSASTAAFGNSGISLSHPSKRKNKDTEEVGAFATCVGEVGPSRSSKSVVNNDTMQFLNEENLNKGSSKTCRQINLQKNLNATKPAGERLNQEDVPVLKKRERRPSSLVTLEGGSDYSWLYPKDSSPKLVRIRKNVSKVPKNSRNFGLYLIGRRVKVWWPLDRMYYSGKITAFKAIQRLYQIEYDDGEIEILDLSQEKWKLIGDKELSSGAQDTAAGPCASTAVFVNSAISLSHPSKRKNQAACEKVTTQTDKNKKVKNQSICQKTAATALKTTTSRIPNSQEEPLDGSSLTLVQDGKAGNELTNVNGYEVNASLAPVLRAIFSKYGDICSPSTIKNLKMRCTMLEVVCNIVKKLQSKDFGLVTSGLKEMMSDISDFAAVKMDVSWLQKHLDEIEPVKEIGQSSSYLMDLKSNSDLLVKAAGKDVDEVKLKSISVKNNLKKAKTCLKAFKVVSAKLEDNVAEYVATKNAWVKRVDELL